MKLAIVAVYLLRETPAALLDLHLARIARHTDAPYVIHGCIIDSPQALRDRLAGDTRMRLHDVPPIDLRGKRQHSHHLEHLVRAAIDDGATHVATLHVDSFPVQDGWASTLVGRLSASCAFATIADINTACLVFTREFYLAHHPTFLTSPAEQASAAFARYMAEVRPVDHSGIGYGFRAWQAGLSWSYLHESSAPRESAGSAIYDDLVFHLKGATRLSKRPIDRASAVVQRLGYRRFERLMDVARTLVPNPARRILRASFLRQAVTSLVDAPRAAWQSEGMLDDAARLVADPDAFIDELRGDATARRHALR